MTTILVVDDELLALGLVQRILERRGFNVVTCSKPLEALDLFSRRKDEISLLVSDVRMPDLDGPALASRLLELKPDLPVLFISGFVSEDELRQAGHMKQSAFLRKPFSNTSLVQAVQRMLMDTGDAA